MANAPLTSWKWLTVRCGWDARPVSGTLDRMAAKKGRSTVGSLIQGGAYLIALLLVAHIVFQLFGFPAETGLARSVQQAAEPLALFFPGLVDVSYASLQLMADFGLAALFWMLLGGVLAKVFG